MSIRKRTKGEREALQNGESGHEERNVSLTREEAGALEHSLSFLTGFFRLLEPGKHFDPILTATFAEASDKMADVRGIILRKIDGNS